MAVSNSVHPSGDRANQGGISVKKKTNNERRLGETTAWIDRISLWGLVITALTMLTLCLAGCGGGGGGSSSGFSTSVQISPSSVTLAPGGAKTFSATVSGSSNTAVVWTCDAGTIDQAGDYFAPTLAGTYTVTATSSANAAVKATAKVTVSQSSNVVVAISPTTKTVALSGQIQFSSTVTGTTNNAVKWSTTLGSISTAGLFTAPSAAATVTVTATSVASPSASASATITVVSSNVQITPAIATIGTNQSVQYSATVSNQTNQAVTWSATGGAISSSGLFHAGESAGTYTITAKSVADPTSSGSVSVTVNAIAVTVTPNPVTVVTGQTQQFSAKVTGATGGGVTWTTSAGTISSAGVLTAPSTAQTVTVTATSTADPSSTGTSTVTIVTPSTFFYDFNSGVPGVWTPTTNETTPSGVKFLGRIAGTNAAQLVLDGLTTHSTITLTFDLFVIGAWGGITDTNTMGVTIGGTSAFLQSFSNQTSLLQSYPLSGSNAPGTGSTGENTLGYTSDPAILYNDTTYHITCNVAHTASSVTIVFTGNLTGTLAQMAWGLKNVQVTANP
jgi:hypothetical protein